MKKVILVLGTGHCGSTLLDLILGSHSKMFSLGEVYRVLDHDVPSPVCDICGEDCDFWTSNLLEKLRDPYQITLLRRIRNKIGTPKEELFYKTLADASKKDILVDSSKKPGLISRVGNVLGTSREIRPYLIYLSRDGRAVVNSYYRKYPERGLEQIAHNWNSRIEAINQCYQSWPNDDKLSIKYESLATKPIETIKEIMDFIGEPFEEKMMQFWKTDHHTVNGNAGTKSMLFKFRDAHKHDEWVDDNGKEYYREKDLGIHFDERWKIEMNSEQVCIVDSIIHELNSVIKYEE